MASRAMGRAASYGAQRASLCTPQDALLSFTFIIKTYTKLISFSSLSITLPTPSIGASSNLSSAPALTLAR